MDCNNHFDRPYLDVSLPFNILIMRKLQLPESQTQEVLYELISRLFIDRKTMMLSSGVMNLTARISELRMRQLKIVSNEIVTLNKFGREIKYVQYSLEDKKAAVSVYIKMKETQSKLPGS